MKITVEVELDNGTTYRRVLDGNQGGNPRFIAFEAQKLINLATADVLTAIEAVHGKKPDL